MYKLKSGTKMKKALAVIALILVAVLSVTVFSPCLSSPEFHSETIQILEEQKTKALALGTTVTLASTGLTLLPDDTATPTANKLADLSLPLFLIVAFIYLEIFMVTTFGWAACTFLIPGICLLAVLYIVSRNKIFLFPLPKLAALTIALLFIIPVSAKVTAQVQDTFKETIEQKYYAAEHVDDEDDADEKEGTNAIIAFFSKVADNVTGAIEDAKNTLSTMIDAVAVLIITSVIIPVLTLLVFMQILKMVTDGVARTEYVEQMLTPKFAKKKLEELEQERVDKYKKMEELKQEQADKYIGA